MQTPVYAMTALPTGWLLVISDPFARSFRFVVKDQKGRDGGSFEFPRDLIEEISASQNAPASAAMLAVLGDGQLWMLPHAKYLLYRPEQGIRPERRLEVPACLASKGRDVTGQEEIERLSAALNENSGQARVVVEQMLEAAKQGRSSGGYFGAIAGVAAYKDYLAVVVRNGPKVESPSGFHLDIWDLSLEKLVHVQPLAERCSSLLGLTDDAVFLSCGATKSIKRLEIPPLQQAQALKDPCKPVGRRDKTAEPARTPDPPR